MTVNIFLLLFFAVVFSATAKDNLLIGKKNRVVPKSGENQVHYRCVHNHINEPVNRSANRDRPWSLPSQAQALDLDTTIHVLVLRFNFQFEETDDPNTTGRGRMNIATPLLVTDPSDSSSYYDYLDTVGHLIDPPPHDSAYYHAHMRALDAYWEAVSEGKVNLTWDIFPNEHNGAYTLPHEMSHYGRCESDSIVAGLEYYFEDCVKLADTAHLIDPALYPDIDFSQYGAVILFHAGSDRQNDIGFPQTCNDLFTGFIKFARPIAVDGGALRVGEALMMPETASQDNRGTALNAVMAHEFGHQLGLPDLYSTRTFMSQLGDFALMDNNGFGTGVDFGFQVGNIFGTVPLYPVAWCRAFLGFNEVHDFRQGDDIRVVAAEIQSSGIKIARLPISENEYYLIENRVEDFVPDANDIQPLRPDSVSNVILWPVDGDRNPTGEYDALIAGSGMAIYIVDESVAAMDFDGDGLNNFDDNQLQNNPNRRFMRLIEADGFVNFGGNYRSGYGAEEDLFRDDRLTEFTPNTNPPSIDNTGNESHIYVSDIRRDSIILDPGMDPFRIDTAMFFSVITDRLVDGFPVRAGIPAFRLSPIADDLDGDGTDEIIVVSGDLLSVVSTSGEDFIRNLTGCSTCPVFIDSTIGQVNRRGEVVPLYAQTPEVITAGPVTGEYAGSGFDRFVVVGYENPDEADSGLVSLYIMEDVDEDGQADALGLPIRTLGLPVALSFGEDLWALSDSGVVYRRTGVFDLSPVTYEFDHDEYHGICRIGENLLVMAGDQDTTYFHYISDTVHTYRAGGHYVYGPIIVDLDLDGLPEIVAFSADGDGLFVTVDTGTVAPSLSILRAESTGNEYTVNPIAGDINLDGYPEVIIGGHNAIYAFNRELTVVSDFPLEIDDRYPQSIVVAAPVAGNIDNSDLPELIFPTDIGNVYSYGLEETFGFPLSGGEQGIGSPLIFEDSTGGKLGYLGADGWFYAWEIDLDEDGMFWPMAGHDASASLSFDQSSLGEVTTLADGLADGRFYAYPNPVLDGTTTIRYYLGKDASEVTLTLYDLSGREIDSFDGPMTGGVDNEVAWDCSAVTPGVYRCLITVDFGGSTENSFTDIAVIR